MKVRQNTVDEEEQTPRRPPRPPTVPAYADVFDHYCGFHDARRKRRGPPQAPPPPPACQPWETEWRDVLQYVWEFLKVCYPWIRIELHGARRKQVRLPLTMDREGHLRVFQAVAPAWIGHPEIEACLQAFQRQCVAPFNVSAFELDHTGGQALVRNAWGIYAEARRYQRALHVLCAKHRRAKPTPEQARNLEVDAKIADVHDRIDGLLEERGDQHTFGDSFSGGGIL